METTTAAEGRASEVFSKYWWGRNKIVWIRCVNFSDKGMFSNMLQKVVCLFLCWKICGCVCVVRIYGVLILEISSKLFKKKIGFQ